MCRSSQAPPPDCVFRTNQSSTGTIRNRNTTHTTDTTAHHHTTTPPTHHPHTPPPPHPHKQHTQTAHLKPHTHTNHQPTTHQLTAHRRPTTRNVIDRISLGLVDCNFLSQPLRQSAENALLVSFPSRSIVSVTGAYGIMAQINSSVKTKRCR